MNEKAPRIVVGVDGSPGSRAALCWTLRYAEQCGGVVNAVMAWVPSTFTEITPMPPALSDEDAVARAEWELRKAVDETSALLATSVPIHREVVRGHAARALLDEAQDEDLLVVGNRGHGGFVGALLGSVSQHCVSHAHCPVVVVRPTAR
ncbi:universal stress protein [Saccharopolyspora pogona]|uniref:universal stress protein n=1 Tax=Saccharopolyspora pogona TaxID=333966 RepID=UPI001684A833|nr:universal stress protein [Saccharopolyspora pogona]